MARGVNKVILIGNLGKDPESRSTQAGKQVVNVTIATSDNWRDKASGEMQERTEWHRVVFFGKLAEIAAQYLRKGSQVYVEGRLQTRKWQDKNGQDRYTTEIIAETMQMLGGRQGMGAPAQQGGGGGGYGGGSSGGGGYGGGGGGYDNEPADYSPAPPKNRPKPSFDDLGDDIPF